MLGWLRTLILYRLLGGRVMVTLAALGWLWRRISGRRDVRSDRGEAENRRAGVSRGRVGR